MTAEAEAGYKKALELDPKMTLARLSLGDLYFKSGKLQAAEDTFKQAIDTDPKNLAAYITLSRYYVYTKHPENAEKLLSDSKKILVG